MRGVILLPGRAVIWYRQFGALVIEPAYFWLVAAINVVYFIVLPSVVVMAESQKIQARARPATVPKVAGNAIFATFFLIFEFMCKAC